MVRDVRFNPFVHGSRIYSKVQRERECPLRTCIRFMNYTKPEITRPFVIMQRATYIGSERCFCSKCHAETALDGLVLHIFVILG